MRFAVRIRNDNRAGNLAKIKAMMGRRSRRHEIIRRGRRMLQCEVARLRAKTAGPAVRPYHNMVNEKR